MLKDKSSLVVIAWSKSLYHELFKITEEGKAISSYRHNFPFRDKNMQKDLGESRIKK